VVREHYVFFGAVLVQDIDPGRDGRSGAVLAPGRQAQSATGHQHPPHPLEGTDRLRNMEQDEGHDRGVEGRILEGKEPGVEQDPGSMGGGEPQHPLSPIGQNDPRAGHRVVLVWIQRTDAGP
jgi:hypothetical protein